MSSTSGIIEITPGRSLQPGEKVDLTKLNDLANPTGRVAAGAITERELAPGLAESLGGGGGGSSGIAADSIENWMIKNGAVTTDKVLDDSITTDKVVNDSITAPKIGTNAVTGPKILDGAVSGAKMEALSPSPAGTYTAANLTVDSKGRVTAAASGTTIPAGVVFDYAGGTVPDGFLICAGQNVSRTTYAALFTAIGTTYGSGDGSTTFTLPDSRGRVAVGKDDMGGSAANRMTSGGSGINGAQLGAAGGAQVHTQTAAEMPAHAHGITTPTTGSVTDGGIARNNKNGGFIFLQDTQSAGSGGAHNNTQPSIVFNKIIKT